MAEDHIAVVEGGREILFGIDDLMRYHGFAFRGGVSHGFKIMQLAFPIISPDGKPERQRISIRTAFKGTGARDAFELVTRCFTENRYEVDDSLMQQDRGETLMRYVFSLSYEDRTVNVRLVEGIVPDEFVRLARKQDRTPAETDRMKTLQSELTARILSKSPSELYEQF